MNQPIQNGKMRTWKCAADCQAILALCAPLHAHSCNVMPVGLARSGAWQVLVHAANHTALERASVLCSDLSVTK